MRLTLPQFRMLARAESCSLPGDGLRIVGPGQNRTAGKLEELGLVRVAHPPGERSRVHVTEEGRRQYQEVGAALTLSDRNRPR